jgi:hypothetical protein
VESLTTMGRTRTAPAGSSARIRRVLSTPDSFPDPRPVPTPTHPDPAPSPVPRPAPEPSPNPVMPDPNPPMPVPQPARPRERGSRAWHAQLSGKTDSLELKLRAIETVRKVSGVRKVAANEVTTDEKKR